jgi:DNA transformation protein
MNIADLPNFGPKSQQMLEQAGIKTVAQLRRLGAVRAYLQVKRSGGNASLNLLWALEGALTGQHWQVVAKHERLRLLLELEDIEKNMSGEKASRMKRERYPLPGFIRDALAAKELTAAYDARPPYQRNDYIGWIMRAKRPDTQQKRLVQMLDELVQGDVYMKMDWSAGRK